MGLFAKRPVPASQAPLYTIGVQKTMLLVGLGNPGRQYDGTRHNIGFDCLSSLVASHSEFSQGQAEPWITKKDLNCLLASGTIGNTRVIAIKPTTFMNDSGLAVGATQHFFKIPSSATIIVHDELDVAFGMLRSQIGGGSAGHNGLKSIISHCGPDFGRIRIGIGPKNPPQIDSADFVLAKFNTTEQNNLADIKKEVVSLLIEAVVSGQGLATTSRHI